MQKVLPHFKDKEHIIWDWNGTLLNDLVLCVNTIGKHMLEHGLEKVSIEKYKQLFGFPIRDYYTRLGFNFEAVSFEHLGKKYIEDYMSRVHECELHPGTREVLEQNKAQGKKQSILSAADQPNLEKLIRSHSIDHLFDHIYGISTIYADSKLERGRELISAAKVCPSKTVLIGDTDHDLEVGKELGIDVILVTHGHQCETRLRSIHHKVL